MVTKIEVCYIMSKFLVQVTELIPILYSVDEKSSLFDVAKSFKCTKNILGCISTKCTSIHSSLKKHAHVNSQISWLQRGWFFWMFFLMLFLWISGTWHQKTEAPKCLIKLHRLPLGQHISQAFDALNTHQSQKAQNSGGIIDRRCVDFATPFQIIPCCFREESLSVAAFQGRQTAEIVQDEGRRPDTVDLNMSVVTQTWPSTYSSAKLALFVMSLSMRCSFRALINLFITWSKRRTNSLSMMRLKLKME